MKYGTAALIGIPLALFGYGAFVKKLPTGGGWDLYTGSTPYQAYTFSKGFGGGMTFSQFINISINNALGRT